MYLIQKNLTRFFNSHSTYFLNPHELKQVASHMKKNEYSIYTPYPDSEKNILYTGSIPQVLLYEIICKSPLRHQDILGTMYSLNIASDLFGDVVIHDYHYYVFILPIVQNYFETNFLMVRNSHVELKEIPIDTLSKYERNYEEIELIVSSTRMDAVLSSLLHVGRGKIEVYLKKKEVLLNYEILKSSSYKLKEGDTFSIRKIGKYQFVGIIKNTKSDHVIISLKKYT
ncbi:MAG: hypothetical protein IKF71_02175 [Bacilli bacterium]|nr:hypothetical protein [Bacilli bacterium]